MMDITYTKDIMETIKDMEFIRNYLDRHQRTSYSSRLSLLDIAEITVSRSP
jgi:hypothetical protein